MQDMKGQLPPVSALQNRLKVRFLKRKAGLAHPVLDNTSTSAFTSILLSGRLGSSRMLCYEVCLVVQSTVRWKVAYGG